MPFDFHLSSARAGSDIPRQPACIIAVELGDFEAGAERCVRLTQEALARSPGEIEMTIFATQRFARDCHRLIRRLIADGHEIACRGPDRFAETTPNARELAERLRGDRMVLEDITGRRVMGFRGLAQSTGAGAPSKLEFVAEAGFLYDSSVVASAPRGARTPYDVYSFSGRPLFEFANCRQILPGGWAVTVVDGRALRTLPLPIIFRLLHKATALGYLPILRLRPPDLSDRYGPTMAATSVLLGSRLRQILARYPNRGPIIHCLQGDRERVPQGRQRGDLFIVSSADGPTA